ncbi:MAG: hypothetical protein COB02_13880 [Candidatus Cloacimonadota bacterium]|nr:MAG: hypothetical protein COB02_13880 [Candidatus Cloacimonadota bacterium]
MLEQIDVIFPVIILIGGLYGFIKGPFSLVLPFISSFFMFPFLMYVKPHLFVFLQNSENLKIYHLIYYPIFGFFCFALVGMLARKLDSKVKKYIPGGKGLWGFIIGVFISSFVCIALMLFSLPLLIQFAPNLIAKSWTMSSLLVWFEQHPNQFSKLEEFLHMDSMKEAIQKVKQIRSGALELNSGEKANEPSSNTSTNTSSKKLPDEKLFNEALKKSLIGDTLKAPVDMFDGQVLDEALKKKIMGETLKESI